MKLGDRVVLFDFAGIPIVGNLTNGYVIGLTSEGSDICKKLSIAGATEEEIAAVDQNLLEHMKRGGFFESPPPLRDVTSAYLHVTQRCNLTCAGCYSDDPMRNALMDAPLNQITHAIDELSKGGVKQLVISGGEPFLRNDLAQIVQYAKKEAAIESVTVLSNGTCIDPIQLSEMTGIVDCVSVSVDGYSSDTPAYIRGEQRFDQLVRAVKAIKKAKIAAHIIPTVHALNVDDIEEYVKLSKRLGVTLNFSVLSCESTSGPLKDLIFSEADLIHLGTTMIAVGEKGEASMRDTPMSMNLSVKRSCGAGCKTLSVTADGTVYPCHMLHRQELAMGNLFKGAIEEVVVSKTRRLLDELDVEAFERCGSCEYMLICGGGCRARSLYSSGALRSYDPYCTMITTFYDALANKMKTRIEG